MHSCTASSMRKFFVSSQLVLLIKIIRIMFAGLGDHYTALNKHRAPGFSDSHPSHSPSVSHQLVRMSRSSSCAMARRQLISSCMWMI
jgi:hypothetical protein